MQIILINSVIIACISAFIILFLTRIGLREKVVVLSPIRLLSELFSCDFCLSFWIGLIITIIFIVVSGNFSLFLCTIITPPITRFLI